MDCLSEGEVSDCHWVTLPSGTLNQKGERTCSGGAGLCSEMIYKSVLLTDSGCGVIFRKYSARGRLLVMRTTRDNGRDAETGFRLTTDKRRPAKTGFRDRGKASGSA